MKKYFLFLFTVLLMVSCKKENEVEQKVAAVPVGKIDIERFDKIFYESDPADLSKVKAQFPYFFPAGNPDKVWIDKIKDPLLQELHQEVEKKYPNTKALQEDLYSLFQHIKYYFPEFRTPKVVTLISEMDYESKTIYTDSLVLISLDLYLGKSHRFYEFPEYMKQGFEPSQIMPDLVTCFAQHKIAPPRDRTLLAQMVYFGKELYLKDVLLPEYNDADKIAYTPEQLKWAEANEAEMWRYFVENKLLYDTSSKLPGRFINPAPFSKFYLEIDNESPGMVGRWLGWQIVRSYMENNKNVTLRQMLVKDAKEIFDNSKYKPKK
jgi:gliding motility-associated lipoprotein GldB